MIINQGLAFENSNLRNDVDLAKASEARKQDELACVLDKTPSVHILF